MASQIINLTNISFYPLNVYKVRLTLLKPLKLYKNKTISNRKKILFFKIKLRLKAANKNKKTKLNKS